MSQRVKREHCCVLRPSHLKWDTQQHVSDAAHMQDMVVFGGVNPAHDLNDVAIWQGM